MNDSTKKRRTRKPKSRPGKPYKDFPLTPHPLGYWCKSIRGKLFYFGRWGRVRNGEMERLPDDDGWQAALDQYNEQKEALYDGRTPRATGDGLTVADLCNRFLTAKEHLLETGELTPRTFHDYKSTTDRVVAVFGKRRLVDDLAAEDFATLRADIAKTYGPVALGNEIGRIRVVFKYAFDAGLTDRPVRYGPTFKKPSKKTLRKERQKNGRKDFDAEEIRAMLNAAGTQLRAMILLGVNCGFGNGDVGNLPITAVDFDRGWIDFPRPKTAIERRCPLWPETVEALRAVADKRPEPKDEADAGLLFITKYGSTWSQEGDASKSRSANPISHEGRKLMKECGIYQKGRGFYGLRHTFQTQGEEAGETATRFLMGHSDSSMSGVYRERISDDRLRAVVDHVHAWLWPADESERAEPEADESAEQEPAVARLRRFAAADDWRGPR